MDKKTLYILIDASGSMRGARADAVNVAMTDVFSTVLESAKLNKQAEMSINVAVLTFRGKNDINWHVQKRNIEETQLVWQPIDNNYFEGETPTGAAINAVIEDLEHGNYGEPDPEEVSPVILLISDGLPNGTNPTYEEALSRSEPNNPNKSTKFRYSTRIAIGINVDDDGKKSLQKFGRLTRQMEGFQAYYDCSDLKLDELVEIIKLVTTGATH